MSQTLSRVDGYRGIWFDLGQSSEYGSKYSGGLGTYTAKHQPLAIYSAEAQKTFFVYGGTTQSNERHLLAMVSYYDHTLKKVPKPIIIHDKKVVDDPHDNPSIQIDEKGMIWVFVSGRGKTRPGHVYRTQKPYDIETFEQLPNREFTYPQPWWLDGKGFAFFFTKYTGVRELYFSYSDIDGVGWSDDLKLAGMGGHYQVSNGNNGHLITAFNMHPGGDPDKRTNLYFIQSKDYGKTWLNAKGEKLILPLEDSNSPALVAEYVSKNQLVYMKDIGFDAKGNPVILYLVSGHYQPGPKGDPRTWMIAHFDGSKWLFHEITTSTHNYDMGSLYIESDGNWKVIAPTEKGPQLYGTGGEIALWQSFDQGEHWDKIKDLTSNSKHNQGYVRRPVNAHPDFYGFWTDGNPDLLTESKLSFTNFDGSQVYQLPYDMEDEFESVIEIKLGNK